MNSLAAQIYDVLKTVSGVSQVSFFYPQQWVDLPAVTFYEQNNSESARVDNGHEFLTDLTYQIDIWAKTPEECLEIATEINEKLRELGFKREFAADLYVNSENGGIHHKTLRFGCKYQGDTEKIYQ